MITFFKYFRHIRETNKMFENYFSLKMQMGLLRGNKDTYLYLYTTMYQTLRKLYLFIGQDRELH